MKYWEIIADNLSKAGWSLGCVSAIDSSGRTIWTADAHRDDGKRFVVRAEENLSIAKGETAPVTEPWRYVYLLATVPDPGHIPGVFLHTPITESSPMIMTSPLNGGAGLAGKNGRKTANACDTNASEMSADTTAHFIFVAGNSFTEVSDIVVSVRNLFFQINFFCQKICL